MNERIVRPPLHRYALVRGANPRPLPLLHCPLFPVPSHPTPSPVPVHVLVPRSLFSVLCSRDSRSPLLAVRSCVSPPPNLCRSPTPCDHRFTTLEFFSRYTRYGFADERIATIRLTRTHTWSSVSVRSVRILPSNFFPRGNVRLRDRYQKTVTSLAEEG